MYVVQEPVFLYRDRVRNIPTYLPTYHIYTLAPIPVALPSKVGGGIIGIGHRDTSVREE